MITAHSRLPSFAMLILGALSPILMTTTAAAADAGSDTDRKLVNEVCTSCHGLGPIEGTRDGPIGWRDTIFKMIQAGAQIKSEAELDTLVKYLSTAYGPSAGQMHTGPLPAGAGVKSGDTVDSASNGSSAADYLARLPAGKGADLVKGYCSMCHDVGRVIATRRSAEEWTGYTHAMLNRSGVPVTRDVSDSIAAYLTLNFGTPGKPRQAP